MYDEPEESVTIHSDKYNKQAGKQIKIIIKLSIL